MGSSSSKRNETYVDRTRDRTKTTCIINGLVQYSEKCKLRNDFGVRYSARTRFKLFQEHIYANK